MTTEEILAALDAIQHQLDTLRDNLIDASLQDRLEEARRLKWMLRGFGREVNVVDIPLSTIQPSEVVGFMKPLTDRSKPVIEADIEADIEAWLRYNNHQGKTNTFDRRGPHSRDCNCVGCRQNGYVILIDRGMNEAPTYVGLLSSLITDKSRATVFTYREAEDYIENTVTCNADRSFYNIVLS